MRGFAWLARLILVLLLVVDQVSAPLHTHHHDFGIDHLPVAAVHDASFADDLHVESGSQSDDGHSVLAIRVEGRTVVAPSEKPDVGKHAAFVALLVSAVSPPVDTRRHVHEWARHSGRLHLTGVIRPQVRAPPLRA